MSYPVALKNILDKDCTTIDIRKDSLAEIKEDYIKIDCKHQYQTIITNPPFQNSLDIIRKALDDVEEDGYVVMLQRLNFMGSKLRKQFWENNIPKYIIVHHKRMGFTGDGKKDSVEYAHYVWHKGYQGSHSNLYII